MANAPRTASGALIQGLRVAQLALAFREKFARDVVIDMVCYRKHGHNETDEPAFTQPLLYQKIAVHPRVSTVLSRKLVAEGTITDAQAEAIKAEYSAALEKNLEKAKASETATSAKRAAATAVGIAVATIGGDGALAAERANIQSNAAAGAGWIGAAPAATAVGQDMAVDDGGTSGNADQAAAGTGVGPTGPAARAKVVRVAVVAIHRICGRSAIGRVPVAAETSARAAPGSALRRVV